MEYPCEINLFQALFHLSPPPRPTFHLFSWHTCSLALIGCLIMCFVINAMYASIAIALCMILVVVLHMRSFPQSWGSISQALIFHQVSGGGGSFVQIVALTKTQ